MSYNKFNNVLIILFQVSIGLFAYFVISQHNNCTQKDTLTYIVYFFLVVNLYIGYYLQKKDSKFIDLQKKLASKNHINNTIFNLQKAIIVVRDDLLMSQANDTFFQTFDFKDIEEFSSKHVCICELFIEKEGVPHIMPMMGKLTWTDYIIAHPNQTHEAYMLDKDGNERIYAIDLKENIFGHQSMVVFTEVTEIRSQADTFQKLFDNSADGLLLLKNNNFLDVNHTLLSMLECPNKETFLALNPQSLLPYKQPDEVLSMELHQKMVDECLDLGVSNYQRLQKKISGETFWCDIAMTKIMINNESVIYVRWRDIDEYKRLQFSLEERVSQQAKALITSSRLAGIGEMMENITHQWKQPLSLILNIIQLMKLEIPNNKDLLVIEEQTQYLNNTIADFKHYTTTSNDNETLFMLRDSVNASLKIFEFQALQHQIKITSKLEKNSKIKGDFGTFNQAVLVLLSNSKDALLENRKEDREIRIKIEESREKIYLIISDNGGGIPNDVIQKIFEPYFTTKFKDKGTGIGLSMTYNIIKQLNGEIEVCNSEYGAVFKIILPKIKH